MAEKGSENAEYDYDLFVIGGGSGGVRCARFSAQYGAKVGIAEERYWGGTCVNVGCVPKKLFYYASHYSEDFKEAEGFGWEKIERKFDWLTLRGNKDNEIQRLNGVYRDLLDAAGVTCFNGRARIADNHHVLVGDTKISAEKILVATGSWPDIPTFTGSEHVISSNEAFSLDKLPERALVIGGGYIGLEMGSVWSRLGAEVTVIEYLDYITPGMDREISNEFKKILSKQGIIFKMGSKVNKVKSSGSTVTINYTDLKSSKDETLEFDKVLVSVGRKPYTEGLNLTKIGVKKDEKGRIEVNAKLQTSIKNIYAIGDVIKGPMLAHKAEEEGIAVAEILAGQAGHVNYDVIPGVIYTSPEVATVGKTEEQLKEEKKSYKVGKFPFLANSRAKVNNETEGFVKILADSKTDKVLGVHIIGPHCGDMIAEMALAMEFGASAEDIARTCHAHPTHTEAIKEAALAVDKRPIHF